MQSVLGLLCGRSVGVQACHCCSPHGCGSADLTGHSLFYSSFLPLISFATCPCSTLTWSRSVAFLQKCMVAQLEALSHCRHCMGHVPNSRSRQARAVEFPLSHDGKGSKAGAGRQSGPSWTISCCLSILLLQPLSLLLLLLQADGWTGSLAGRHVLVLQQGYATA